MGSLIPGYEYDIFISYRQKDNKHDGWVAEFVNNLKGELESTFKEDISVYFDINPHDGLLETHDVNASLKVKLKCLVFIPIISRIYCDTKSFAWEHEFKAFIEQASKDQFGLKVKLQTGNVANRVLPIQIHDLCPEDKATIEKELGSVLRAIEFIYKEPGVNRPLTAGDDKDINLNKTKYRNQINKAAIAIEEVIHGLRTFQTAPAGNFFQYDYQTPDVKESSALEAKDEKSGFNRKSKRWVASGLLLALIIALTFGILRVIEKSNLANDTAKLEKSIAVLPFINDSPDKENEYFCNGMMDEILNNLQRIKDFRVLSRTSVEQYRNSVRPTIPGIAKSLGVNYIIEGSGQKYGNTFRLRVQLIEAVTDKHLWAKSYEQDIKEPKDIFSIQNQIAESIATELKAIITPEEKELISKIPTANINAYDLYLKANDYKNDFFKTRNLSSYQTAVNLYETAVKIDTAFAKAYTGLAELYYSRYYWESYFKKEFLDSCLILINTALLIDNQLDEAYLLRGRYFSDNGRIEEARENIEKAIMLNPNNSSAYNIKGYLLTWVIKDFAGGIENYQKALSLIQGEERPSLLYGIGSVYIDIGFIEEAKLCIREALSLDNDSVSYYDYLAWIEFNLENYKKALDLQKKATDLDSTGNIAMDYYNCLSSEYKEEVYLNAKKTVERYKNRNAIPLQYAHRIGYAFWQVGRIEEANYYFNEQIRYGEESIKLNRDIAQKKAAHYDLAATYAFLGKKEKAYKYLEDFGNMNSYPLWWVSLIRHDPLFNSIRHEEQFQKIQKKVESKYQAEHERIRKWLEEKG